MASWKEEYKRKFTTAEEAVREIRSGDRVAFTYGREPLALGLALASRKEQLTDVKLFARNPHNDFGWYDPGWEENFKVDVSYVLPLIREKSAERRCDLVIGGLTGIPPEHPVISDVDFLFTEVSPPDDNGVCSFGASVWGKRKAAKHARKVIAEVNNELIRTYGDNSIHISEIDAFVEHIHEEASENGDLLGREVRQPGQVEKQIAHHVGTLVRDGDTLQIGVGNASEWLAPLGAFDNRADLGWHSEVTARGIVKLIREGIITGKHKRSHQGKAVAVVIGEGNKQDLEFVHNNPMFELYDADYVLDPRVIAANDNVLAMNSALAIDLTGQIAAESIGPTMLGGPGGQLAFATGAQLSKGGRFVSVLPSTAKKGSVSRIVPMLEQGTVVTVSRTLADIVVTEYGIAHLRNRSLKERALELISVTHPDFRDKLRTEAEKLYWP
ncbi:MAG: acetyl-CoA hydrolase/transferase family protein [Chloroflexota bacterium]